MTEMLVIVRVDVVQTSVTSYITAVTDYAASFSVAQLALKVADAGLNVVEDVLKAGQTNGIELLAFAPPLDRTVGALLFVHDRAGGQQTWFFDPHHAGFCVHGRLVDQFISIFSAPPG